MASTNDLIKQYQISERDLYLLATLETRKSVAGFFKKDKLKSKSVGVLKPYNVKFLDLGYLLDEIKNKAFDKDQTLIAKYGQVEEEIEDFIARTNKKKESDAIAKADEKVNSRLDKLKALSAQIKEISETSVVEVTELKSFIMEKEKAITDKGGDDKLFQFLKLDTFLKDFRNKIIDDIATISNEYNEYEIELSIKSYEQKDTLEKIADNFRDMANSADGKLGNSFNSKIERYFAIGDLLKPAITKEISTLQFYNSMAIAMLVFYLDDKKIRFFEIYESFEKLGAFDSSWQKKVAEKLTSIDLRLTQLNNQMTELNENFVRLADTSEVIANELKTGLAGINSRLDANNLLQGITAYQTYRVNKNTK